jgi:hypothetical protein
MNWSARGNVLNQYLRNTSIGTTVNIEKIEVVFIRNQNGYSQIRHVTFLVLIQDFILVLFHVSVLIWSMFSLIKGLKEH